MEIILSIEEKLVRNIDVVADIKGYPAENFELADYTLNPEYLTVEGPARIIEKNTCISNRGDKSFRAQ